MRKEDRDIKENGGQRWMCVVVRGRLVGVSEEGRQRYKGRWRKDGCVLWIEEDWWG